MQEANIKVSKQMLFRVLEIAEECAAFPARLADDRSNALKVHKLTSKEEER